MKITKFNPSLLLLVLLTLILLLRIDWDMFLYRPGIITSDESLYLQDLKSTIEANFAQILPEPQAGLLSGMVLGAKQALPEDFKRALVNTSTIHIVVASGQNLTILSGMVIGFASLIGRKKAIFASIGTNLFYSILTGFQIPIIRAAIMNIFASLGMLSGREAPTLFALFFSAMIMLIYEPLWLFSVSFQLSFLASFAVMEFAPVLETKVRFLPDIVKQDLISSSAAFFFTLPIIFENFHRLSLTGILVNALVLWTTPLITASGVVLAMVSLVSINLASVLSLIPGVFLTYLVYIVRFFNNLSPSVDVEPLGLVFWSGYYLLLLSVYFYARRGKKDPKLV